MAFKPACMSCKRPWSTSNLITNFDILTQSAYLIEDGYLFRNVYWHLGTPPTMPRPKDMEEYLDDLHKETTPVPKGSFLEHQTDYFRLYQFKFIWFTSTQTILCRLPYAGRNWFEQATFFLPPVNEPEPDFNDLDIRMVTRWQVAGYAKNEETKKWERKRAIFRKEVKTADYILKPKEEVLFVNNDGSKWVKTAHYYEGPDKEEPSDDELRFLKVSTERLKEWSEMEQKTCHNQEFVDKTKLFLKDYAPGGEWTQPGKLKIKTYQEVRVLMLTEGSQLIRKIEKKIDKTRKGYELYTVAGPIKKINDERLLISLERDFISEWWPRAYNLEGLWQFSRKPITKKMLENWENGRPLQSCVFCPSEAGLPSTRSDDFAFADSDLIKTVEVGADGLKKDIQRSRAFHLGYLSNVVGGDLIEQAGEGLGNIETVRNLTAANLQSRMEILKQVQGGVVDSEDKKAAGSFVQTCQGELGRRKEELEKTNRDKDKLEKEKEEIDEKKARLENEIEQHKQDREKINEDIKEKEKQQKKNQELYEEKVKKQSEMDERSTQMSGELRSLRTQIETNKTTLHNITDTTSSSERASLRDRTTKLEHTADELEKKLADHDKELRKINREIEGIEREMRLVHSNLQDLHINQGKHDDAIEELNRKLGDLTRRQGELERENNDLRTKLGEMKRPDYLGGWTPSGGSGGGGVPPGGVTPTPRVGKLHLILRIRANWGFKQSEETVEFNSVHEAEVFANAIKDEGGWTPSGGGDFTQTKRNLIYNYIINIILRCRTGEDLDKFEDFSSWGTGH